MKKSWNLFVEWFKPLVWWKKGLFILVFLTIVFNPFGPSQEEKEKERLVKKDEQDKKRNEELENEPLGNCTNGEWQDASENRKLITSRIFLWGILKNDGANENVKENPNFEKMAVEMKDFITVTTKERPRNDKDCTTAAAGYYNILKNKFAK